MALVVVGLNCGCPGFATSVLTYHNDNARTGANTHETILTLENVNTNDFGLLMKYEADGYVYAQPLYFAGLTIPGEGTHNAVFVATENNSVYAFDADSIAGADGRRLWHANLGDGIDIVTNHEFGGRYHNNVFQDMLPRVGITGTPVIDPVTGTLYVDAFTREVTQTATNYHHILHALNITNGTEQAYGPVEVNASAHGTGVGSSNGLIKFEARQHLQRPAMTLAGGVLYVAFGSAADTDPYHGWVIGYDASNLRLLTNEVFNTTPNATTAQFGSHAGEGALWMGGNGLCVDANTNLYFEVANGTFTADPAFGNGLDFGDSFLKLSTAGQQLKAADFFTPFDQAKMQADDADFGSGGALLLPDEVGSAAHPHLIVGGDKASNIYLVDRDNMGHYNSTNNQQIVEEFNAGVGRIFSTPAYFNKQLYYQGIGGVLKAYGIDKAWITPKPNSETKTSFSGFGTTPSISANGTENGIVWTIQSDGAVSHTPAILHAYNATNLAIELYNSSQLPQRDNPGNAVKMTVPTIADGKVFVGAQHALAIFGNGIFLPAPTISPSGGEFINSVAITLSEQTSGATIYFSLDGTLPTMSSLRYTGPFLVTNTVNLRVIAIKSGAVNSGVTAATFVNTAAAGGGSGLLGQFWTDANPADFNQMVLTRPALITQTNALLNSKDRSLFAGQLSNFVARWSGSLQPQYDDTYELTVITAGGVRLRVNETLLINDWIAHALPTTNRCTIKLTAQQLYNLQLESFQATVGSVELLWNTTSAKPELIPLTQLYPFTNPPPTISLVTPANDATYTANASVTIGAEARTLHNEISRVDFFANGKSLGSLRNSIYAPVYAITATGLIEGSYSLTVVVTDGSGLTTTSGPVNIYVNAASGQSYGLTMREKIPAFLNFPATFSEAIPRLLSATGLFSDLATRAPVAGLIPYRLNAPMWNDGAVASCYLAVPSDGSIITPDQQIRLRPTNSWKFPNGTVFVKNLDLTVDKTNPKVARRRLETQILVRDMNGAVYGASYKWRADNREADLLTTGLSEDLLITNATGIRTQTWYYASPSDCLTCHTPLAGYVLGVNTRQLNGSFTYPLTAKTDNQIRTLNRLGLFSPAINETQITNFAKLVALTNESASLAERVRSYFDVNCAQCHRPGGVGNFDARFDTPSAEQKIVDAPAAITLGLTNACIVAAGSPARSVLYQRLVSQIATVKMPPLGRNLVDTQAVNTIGAWINQH